MTPEFLGGGRNPNRLRAEVRCVAEAEFCVTSQPRTHIPWSVRSEGLWVRPPHGQRRLEGPMRVGAADPATPVEAAVPLPGLPADVLVHLHPREVRPDVTILEPRCTGGQRR